MTKWTSPYYFGTQVIAGVMRLVRRMTRTSALEIIPEGELKALHEEQVASGGTRHRMITLEDAVRPDLDPSMRAIAACLDPGQEVNIYATVDMNTGEPLATMNNPKLEALTRYDQAIADGDGARAAAPASAGIHDAPFVTRTCVIPGCGQTFETRQKGRLVCDSHVGDSTPDPVPEIGAALPSAGMLKQTVPDNFGGLGLDYGTGLLADPEYIKARNAGDTAEMARIAHEFWKKK